MKVMVIDDSAMVRAMVGRTLRASGYEVIDAVDGQDGLAKLAAHDDLRLILCDVNIPVMSGLEFLEATQGIGSRVPVVMLTTEGQPEMIARAKTLGARGWIVKPFKPDMLLEMTRAFFA